MIRGSNEVAVGVLVDGVAGAESLPDAVPLMKPKEDPADPTRAGLALAGSFIPVIDKLPNAVVASHADATSGGEGEEVSEFMNSNEDFLSADVVGATALADIKSRRLLSPCVSLTTDDSVTGSVCEAGAICKPPNKDPAPILVGSGAREDCLGEGGSTARASVASLPSKSNKLAMGAGAASTECTDVLFAGGTGTPPTGVATPKKFSTRLAGSRMACRE